MARDKFAKNSADIEASNGEITFIAARSVKNLNGWTYDVKSLQAQNASGDYQTLTAEPIEVAIPLMSNHSKSIENKIGTIDQAQIETVDGIDQVVMHAKFFTTDEAQVVRQRILDGELTDVSITTDLGSGYSDEDDVDVLKNAHIIEVSVVYAGAETKAKILAKNSIENETIKRDGVVTTTEDEEVDTKDKTEEEDIKQTEETKTEEPKENGTEEEETEEIKENEPMATQPNENTTEVVANKADVLASLAKLAKSGAIRGMNRSQVIEAVKNDITIEGADGNDYVVPDAVFSEILAATRPTDILETFRSVPLKRYTVLAEERSEEDAARAGKYTKDELKTIQALVAKAQVFKTEFIYKLQKLSYEDLQEDFGDILYAFVSQELPQKVSEEEERAFIVGDGRATNDDRHISSIVSLDAAAEDATNIHVYNYDGTGDASPFAAGLFGVAKIGVAGTKYAVLNTQTLASLRAAGIDTVTGLPFSEETVAGALGVSRIYTRDYVANNVIYVWTENAVVRLTGGSAGETIEQYDIDYNNHKIEFIRPSAGGATGLYSAVKISLSGASS